MYIHIYAYIGSLQTDANYATVTDTELIGDLPTASPMLGKQTCTTGLCSLAYQFLGYPN